MALPPARLAVSFAISLVAAHQREGTRQATRRGDVGRGCGGEGRGKLRHLLLYDANTFVRARCGYSSGVRALLSGCRDLLRFSGARLGIGGILGELRRGQPIQHRDVAALEEAEGSKRCNEERDEQRKRGVAAIEVEQSAELVLHPLPVIARRRPYRDKQDAHDQGATSGRRQAPPGTSEEPQDRWDFRPDLFRLRVDLGRIGC